MSAGVVALTMVKEDHFFLQKWVDYYGKQFGRENLCVVLHGEDLRNREIAEGCSILVVPGEFNANFDHLRWQFLSGLVSSLLIYHRYVICCDVDEFVVVDPQKAPSLAAFLGNAAGQDVITPLGLELVHRPEEETAPITASILGPRRFARYSTRYSKPSVIGRRDVQLARGGHYSTAADLQVHDGLYLMHMKYCDRDLYIKTARKRSDAALADDRTARGKSPIAKDWLRSEEEARGHLDHLAAFPVLDGFDFTGELKRMKQTWSPRNERFFHFEKKVGRRLYQLPDRFFGIV